MDTLFFIIDPTEVLCEVELSNNGVGPSIAVLQLSTYFVKGFVSGIFKVAFGYPGQKEGVTRCVLNEAANEFSKGLCVRVRVIVVVEVISRMIR